MNALRSFIVFLLTMIVLPAYAGSTAKGESKFTFEQLEPFAKKVERYAASKGARAFIIARVGRMEDELPKGVQFTHTAIAVYSTIQLADGQMVKGYAIHNLYQKEKDSDKSQLVTDYPIDFLWSANSLKAGIIIPTPELQARLIDIIASGKNKQLHNPKYSAISNPFNSQFQNCTEYTLDIINAAIYQTTDIRQLKANGKAHFSPHRIKVNRLKLMLGSLFMDDIALSDHSSTIYTATFSSIKRYLQENGLVKDEMIMLGDASVDSI